MKKQLLLVSSIIFALVCTGSVYAKAESSTHHNRAEQHRQHKPSLSGKVDINSASASQLAALKHIGVKKAAAIVAYRNAHGSFKSIEDLSKVKGISQRIVTMNKQSLAVS